MILYSSGWYSLTSYFVSNLMVTTFETALYSLQLPFFTMYYFGFFGKEHLFRMGLMIVIYSLTMFCAQQTYSIVCIVMHKTKYLAASVALIILILLTFYSNFFRRVRDVSWIYYISEFAYVKYNINSLIITVYGLGRCPYGFSTKSYFDYGITGDQEISSYILRLGMTFFILTVVHYFTILFAKINFKNLNITNILKISEKQQDIVINRIEMTSNFINEYDSKKLNEIMIAWTDLTLSIPIKSFYSFKSQSLQILNAINGSFDVQSLNALMGPSGAGKSSLLKCLNAKYNQYLSEESKIFLKLGDISRNVFIKQDISEHLLSGLTVKQTLLYASKLKNPGNFKNLDHNSIISQILSDLMICDTLDNRVESCSGGEQKRIAIACELTAQTKPNILFIDEPTSGLDSMAALLVYFFYRSSSKTIYNKCLL